MSEDSTPGRRPSVSEDAIVAVFEVAEDPVLSTAEVADELPIGRRAALERLKRLADAGRLKHKTVGPRGRVWWLADASRDDDVAEDPFLNAPTYASGRSDVSASVDEKLVEAVGEEPDS